MGTSSDFYTGRMYEEDFLGSIQLSPKYWQRLQELSGGRKSDKDGGPYISFKESLQLAREFQKDDPTNPSGELLRELRLAVLDVLEIPEDQLDRVRIFTGVKARGDFLHGIDAFVEVRDPPQKRFHIVTIDLTQNPNKAGASIAEVCTSAHERDIASIVVGALPEPENDTFINLVEEIGTVVAEQIRILRQKSEPRLRRTA